MRRPRREEYKDGIYHVIARGNNKEYIFKESIDKGYFINAVRRKHGRYVKEGIRLSYTHKEIGETIGMFYSE